MLLDAAAAGDRHAAAQLLPLVYDELRKLAAVPLAGEAADHTLQPTALVHEAYLRLVGDQRFDGRGHFFAARNAATALATSPAFAGRSAGSKARQRWHNATSSGSAPDAARRAKQSSILPHSAIIRTDSAVSPTEGGLPVRRTARMAPRPNTAARVSTLSISPPPVPEARTRECPAGFPPACATPPPASG
jgi:hypothetical protein